MDMWPYFSGERLYGDDFTAEQIAEWFADEAEGYAAIGTRAKPGYRYGYHALNALHAYRRLPKAQRFKHALGMGSADGAELEPIIGRLDKLTIVDPSDSFSSGEVYGLRAAYLKPHPSGTLPFADNSIDLIACISVLHHIPNVSFVIREVARVMSLGGYAIIREPIVSMGDWRKPRRGMTKRERGIPLHILQGFVRDAGLEIAHEALCLFAPMPRVFRGNLYNSRLLTWVDAIFSQAFAWNIHYHPRSALQKIAPSAVYMVTRKSPSR